MVQRQEIEERKREDAISELRSLGLSTYEALTFHALSTHREMTAADLCKETGIPDSKIYQTLEGLEEKGMIAVQKTRPSLYRTMRPEEAMSNLRRRLEEEHRRRLEGLEKMASKLSDLYENVGDGEEVELAYIVRGIRAITMRAKSLIKNARRSLMLFVPDSEIWQELDDDVANAIKRGIGLELGITGDIDENSIIQQLPDKVNVKRIGCYCFVLVVDGKTMINVRDWSKDKAVALLTQEPTMIRFASEYFSNPSCCLDIK